MGEQMSAFREMLAKDEKLRGVVKEAVARILLLEDQKVLEILEDPSVNATVTEILQEVGRRIHETGNEKLRDHYRILCQMTGVSVTWEKGDPVPDKEPRSIGKIPLTRMTGRIEFDREGGKKEVRVIDTRMKYIEDGQISMEICVDSESMPVLRRGDEITLVRGIDKVNVRVTQVEEYRDIAGLVEGVEERLKKWLPKMSMRDLEIVADRMFNRKKVEGRKLIAFEFEKV